MFHTASGGRLILSFALLAGCGRLDFTDAPRRDASLAMPDGARDAAPPLVDLNGGASWGGWQLVGASLIAGQWVEGAVDRTYDIYTTSFVLDPAQTVTAATLTDADVGDGVRITGDTGDLFDNNWQAGDRIFGIGFAYSGTTRLSNLFIHFDYEGTNIVPASSVGATDGAYSFNAGDAVSYSAGDQGTQRFREWQYAVFTAFSPDGSNNYAEVYGQPLPATSGGPGRSFVVLDVGQTALAITAQYLHNFDAAQRIEAGAITEGACTAATRVSFQEIDAVTAMTSSFEVLPIGTCL